MKYTPKGETIPQDMRQDLNEKILYLIRNDRADEFGITQEDIYNAYTGSGGLHGLNRSDYDSYSEYSEAKKEMENGQFFTPPAICRFIAETLSPSKGDLVADKTTPRLIQFHTLKNAANPPFLGGFSIFGTVAAEAEQRSCQGDSLFSMILCNDRKAIVTE